MPRLLLTVLALSAAAQAQTQLADYSGPASAFGFGHGLDVVPDADGDGMADLLVGAPGRTSPTYIQGRVELRSSASGTVLRTWLSPSTTINFGASVAALGDVNADGVIDYAFGSPSRLFDGGSVYIHSGADGSELLRVDDDGTGKTFGSSLAAPGDVDGDGVPDLAIGDHYGGDGFGDVTLASGSDGLEIRRWTGNELEDLFGFSLAVLDDLDGDGARELAIGAPTGTFSNERAYVDVYSCGSGIRLRRMFEPMSTWSWFGFSLARCGDLDGDGFGEVVIGAPLGHPDFVDVRSPVTGALLHRWLETTNNDANGFGQAVAGVGDVNGDGYDDIAAAALDLLRLDVRSGRNGALLYSRPLPVTNAALAVLRGGLDHDRDGFADIVVSSPPAERVMVFRGYDTPSVGAYCVAKTSSMGCVASASFSGLPTLSGPDNFVARFSQVHNGVAGIVYWGVARANSPFLGGTLCVQPPRQRTPLQLSGGAVGGLDCSGELEFAFSHAYLLQHSLAAGSTVDVQAWFRDPGHPDGSNSGLTGGLEFVLQP